MKSIKKKHISVSFVVPCLNEERTLPVVLKTIQSVRRGALKGHRSEIVVSDNGSTDKSIAIAKKMGARVVHCPDRGYGAALSYGFNSAKMDSMIFADADNTYDFTEAPSLVKELEKGYDLVVGSRINGKIHDGAMPWKHRFIGTPILTFLINLLHGKGKGKYSDCNSGFRCFTKSAWESWGVKSDGMEFASEMLVKAMRKGAVIAEVPISLRPDIEGREPHLRTWQDGMRHFMQIFMEAPAFFQSSGILIWLLSWSGLITAYFTGVVLFGPVGLFGPHSSMFFSFGSCFGMIVWSAGLFISAKEQNVEQFSYRWFLDLSEDKLFWLSLILGIVSTVALASIVVAWSLRGFSTLAHESELLLVVTTAINVVLLIWNSFTAHLIKKIIKQHKVGK